jgi:hypothetical protein
MDKTLKIVVIMVCVLSVLVAMVGWALLPACIRFLNQIFPDTRGLQLNPIYRRTDTEKFLTVINTGKETLFMFRFYDENNDTIKADLRKWNGSCYVLPSEHLLSLTMDGQQFYSHEIYVEFSDGYKCKLAHI